MDSIRGLRAVLEGIEWPVLFHCGSGVDRTGLAAAMVLLLEGNHSPAEVERQVSSLARLSAEAGVQMGFHNHAGYVGASIWDVSPVNTTLVSSPTRVRMVLSVVGSRFCASSTSTKVPCRDRPRR